MTRRVFVDTNIAVYVFDESDRAKQQAAKEVFGLSTDELVISSQVLSEFYVTVTRKLTPPLDAANAARAVDHLSELEVVSVDDRLVGAAIATQQTHQLSYWDSLIIEAAAVAGCDEVLTEDLSAGSTVRDMLITNPLI